MINNRTIDILVVEDEMNTDLLTQKIKNEFKDNVRIHTNGHGILNDLQDYNGIDLIIVDEQYSKEDLEGAVKTIRKKSPGTEVVVISSDENNKAANKIKEAGAFDYLYKDRTTVDKIIYIIRSFWTRKELAKENINLKLSRKKSNGTVIFMVVLIIAIAALLVYYFFK